MNTIHKPCIAQHAALGEEIRTFKRIFDAMVLRYIAPDSLPDLHSLLTLRRTVVISARILPAAKRRNEGGGRWRYRMIVTATDCIIRPIIRQLDTIQLGRVKSESLAIAYLCALQFRECRFNALLS